MAAAACSRTSHQSRRHCLLFVNKGLKWRNKQDHKAQERDISSNQRLELTGGFLRWAQLLQPHFKRMTGCDHVESSYIPQQSHSIFPHLRPDPTNHSKRHFTGLTQTHRSLSGPMMITFYPNCTLPSHTGAYIAAPNVRSTLEIVWSCTSILILCSWSILHLNVQPQYTSQSRSQKIRRLLWLTWRKLKWMLLSLAAAEYILAKAIVSHRSARFNFPRLKTFAEANGVPWSMTHTFLADMGGIVMYFTDELSIAGIANVESQETPGSASDQQGPSSFDHDRIGNIAEQRSYTMPQRHISMKHNGIFSSVGAESVRP